MKHDMKTIREALARMHNYAIGESRSPYMQIPANPREDADLILSSAIDELDRRRLAAADDGKYPDRASLLARIETLEKERDFWSNTGERFARQLSDSDGKYREAERERDAAKADAARLREELRKYLDMPSSDGRPERGPQRALLRALTVAASDSADWLAKHDAEVRAPLEKRIAELEVSEAEAVERAQEMEMRAATTHENARATCAAMRKDIDEALEKNAELTQQLDTLLGGA